MPKQNRPRFEKRPECGAESLEIPEQIAAVRQFVAQVGGIEKARGALELLALLTDAGRAKSKH